MRECACCAQRGGVFLSPVQCPTRRRLHELEVANERLQRRLGVAPRALRQARPQVADTDTLLLADRALRDPDRTAGA